VRTVLRRLVRRLRAVWPEVAIELRADSGFAAPEIYRWCEALPQEVGRSATLGQSSWCHLDR
jgi:hypothetical protein